VEEKVKLVGGVGGIFLILGVIPYVGFIFGILGLVLILIAIKQISDKYKEEKIFKNFITGVLIQFLGMLVAIGLGLSVAIPFFTILKDKTATDIGVIISIALAIILLYIATVVSGLFYKKALSSLGKITDNDLFTWAGNLIFWGSIATILFLLGSIVVWIGWILLTVAFFTTETESNNVEGPPKGAES